MLNPPEHITEALEALERARKTYESTLEYLEYSGYDSISGEILENCLVSCLDAAETLASSFEKPQATAERVDESDPVAESGVTRKLPK